MDKIKREKLSKLYKRSVKRCEKFELPVLKRSFVCHFLETSLNDNERAAHQAFKEQIVPDRLLQEIIVPKNIAENDARKALKLLKLQHSPNWNFQVIWEGHSVKKTLITEKPMRF